MTPVPVKIPTPPPSPSRGPAVKESTSRGLPVNAGEALVLLLHRRTLPWRWEDRPHRARSKEEV